MCGASLAGYDRFFSLGRPPFASRAALAAVSYDIASLVGSLIAMPCLSVLDGFCGQPGARYDLRLSVAHGALDRAWPRHAPDQQSLGARRRSTRSRMPASML